jgi:hypothetical protein
MQYTLEATDYYGAYSRALVSATSRLRMVTGFEGNQLLPDNTWILYRQEFLNYQRQDMWMAALPSYPATDGYNRGQFIQEMAAVPPYSGADNALIEFGYQENGLPSALNCTTRNDPCLANAATVQIPPYSAPFYFQSEQPAGIPCSAGCTIAIPAISQRMLFYRVLYRSGTKQVAASAITAVNVP